MAEKYSARASISSITGTNQTLGARPQTTWSIRPPAILGGPLAGLFRNRLGPEAQAQVREGMRAHVDRLATPGPDGEITLPAEVVLAVAERD